MRSRFSRYFRSLTLGLGLVIVAIVGLRCAVSSRKDSALLHIPVNYARIASKSVYTSRQEQLPAKVKEGFRVVKVSDLRGAKDIAQLLREGFVLNAITVKTAEKAFYFNNRGGGKDPLFNPNELKYCNAFERRSERPLPKPLSKRRLKGSESPLDVSRRLSSSVRASKGRTDNPSSLLKITDSSEIFNEKVSSQFLGRPHKLLDWESLLPPEALAAIEGHTKHNKENLERVQGIKGKSIIIEKDDKVKERQHMDDFVNELAAKAEEASAELRKLEEDQGSTEEINAKREQLKELKSELIYEREQRDYHFEYTLSLYYELIMTPRKPERVGHGGVALSFQVHDQEKLSEEEKRIIDHNLKKYINDYTESTRLNTKLPGKKKRMFGNHGQDFSRMF